MKHLIIKAALFDREPSRDAGFRLPGRYPTYAPTNKLRALLAAGHGEMLSAEREVNRLFRTEEEPREEPRRATTPEEVTQMLGLDQADEHRIQRLLLDTNVEMTPRTQTHRLTLGRERLVSCLRAMKHIPPEVRQELTKRALSFWRNTVATDYNREPMLRYVIRKALASGKLVPIREPWVFLRAPDGLVKSGPPSGFVAIQGSKHGGYHKRIGDKWEYWYPGQVPAKETGKHVVTGETFPIKDKLKALGGRWDGERKGWWVPGAKADEALAILVAEERKKGLTAGAATPPPKRVAISGQTYEVREKLKRLGGKWDADRKAWMVPEDKADEARRLVSGAAKSMQTAADVAQSAKTPSAPAPAKTGGYVRDPPAGTKFTLTYESYKGEPPRKIGEVIRSKSHGIVTVIGSLRPWYLSEEDAEDFGNYGQYGWSMAVYVREATEEEAAPIREQMVKEERGRAERAKKAERVQELISQVRKDENSEKRDDYLPKGEVHHERKYTTGFASGFVLAEDKSGIYYFSYMTDYPTTFWRVPWDEEMASEIRSLSTPVKHVHGSGVDNILAQPPPAQKKSFGEPFDASYDALIKAVHGSQVAGHKYIARKPDGYGGWLYKYKGSPNWQHGQGEHEGTTQAPVFITDKGPQAKGRAVDKKGFQPTIEEHPEGGEVHHLASGMSVHLHPAQSEDHHRAEWARHKTAYEKLKKTAKTPMQRHAAHAHRQAANLHSKMHNEKTKERQKAKPKGVPGLRGAGGKDRLARHQAKEAVEAAQATQPQGGPQVGGNGKPQGQPPQGPPQRPQGAPGQAQGPQGQPGQAVRPGGPPGAQAGPSQNVQGRQGAQRPLEQGMPPARPGQSQPGQMQGSQEIAPEPYEEMADPEHGTHVEPSEETRQLGQNIKRAMTLTGQIKTAQAHVQDMQQRIAAVRADKRMPDTMKARLVLQHAAEMTAAAHEMARMTDEHQEAMDALEAHRDAVPGMGDFLDVLRSDVHGEKAKSKAKAQPKAAPAKSGKEQSVKPQPAPASPDSGGGEEGDAEKKRQGASGWLANFSESFGREMARGGGAPVDTMNASVAQRERQMREEKSKLVARKAIHPVVRDHLRKAVSEDVVLVVSEPATRAVSLEW